MRVQFVLEALSLDLDRNDGCSDLPCLADDLFVVETAVSQQEVDFEGVGGDAVEDVFDRVGLLFVAADVCHGECDRLAVGDDVDSTVAMTCGCTVFGSHPTEFAVVLVVRAVIGVIDEVDGDDSRPLAVENRHSEASEQEIGGEFEPASVEGMQPVHDCIVARRLVSFVADLPYRGLIDGWEDDDSPDLVGIEERILDSSHRELCNEPSG